MSATLFAVRKDAVGAFGLDPQESPYQIITSRAHWRLRNYGGDDRSRSLLIIAAPIKRPYIWDLAPSISAIRFCLHQGLQVQLDPHRPEFWTSDDNFKYQFYDQPTGWTGPKVTLDWPTLYDIRQDPFERAPLQALLRSSTVSRN
jgi:hypothetical protein